MQVAHARGLSLRAVLSMSTYEFDLWCEFLWPTQPAPADDEAAATEQWLREVAD